MIILLKITGWLLACAPECLLHFMSWLLGPAVLLVPRRRHLVHSNLHHAFPGRARAWRRRIALASSRRLVETGMLSLASPFMSDARLRALGRFSPALTAALARRAAQGGKAPPVLASTAHMAYWECLSWLALFTDYRTEVGVVFRPLKNEKLNTWIKTARERHGMKTFSRKEGLMEIFRTMRRGNVVSVLFDQNTGKLGALTTLFGRVCSTTEFPGMLVERYKARLVVIHPRRLGFWRFTYEYVDFGAALPAVGATVALNRWLENALAADDNLCASWLWSHGRWHSRHWVRQRFAYWTNKNFLDEELALRGLTRAGMPRKTRFWFRLPGGMQGVPGCLFPLLRRLRESRPDIELTLFARAGDLAALQPLIDERTADKLVALPPAAAAARRMFRELRHEYPDTILNLDETPSSDNELRLVRCPELLGLVRPGAPRPRLTHCYEVPAALLSSAPAQTMLWEKLFEHFGLPGKI